MYSGLLLGLTLLLFVIVGTNPQHPVVQPIDDWWFRVIDSVRSPFSTTLAKVLDFLGGVYVTTPIRIGVTIWLLFRRRWRALATWLLTWVLSEVTVTIVKAWFDRQRPPGTLVAVSGSSFPSGHATAVAATAVALVLVLLPEGPTRRKWEITAVAVTFLMSLSRTYLNAHWLSDVVAGSLLGAGVAILSAGITTEVRDAVMRRRARTAGASPRDRSQASPGAPADPPDPPEGRAPVPP